MKQFTPEQQLAILTLDRNVAVSAGAGAGKTRVLVERYMNILRQKKASCEEIIAITFTKKAAKEMRERLRVSLIEELAASDGEERAYWNTQKSRLEYAPISTFHSLCGRILRENPVEACLDPNFSVMEDSENKVLLQKTVETVILAAADRKSPWLASLLQEFSLRTLYKELPPLCEELQAAGWLNEELSTQLAAPYEAEIAQLAARKIALLQSVTALVGYAGELKAGSAGRGKLECLGEKLAMIAQKLELLDADFLSFWQSEVKETLKNIRLSGDAKAAKEEMEEALGLLAATMACQTALILIPSLAAFYQELHSVWNQAKSVQQALNFADLELKTLQLLKEYPDICQKYCQKYRYLMVDEFQDTNDRQREFVYLLAGGDSKILYGHKLFIVGDPKQSIYRFRGADVQVFEKVRKEIEASGGVSLALDTNFRSQSRLVAFGNQLFDRLFAGDTVVSFQPTKGHKTCDGQENFVEWLIAFKPTEEGELSDRQLEAAMIAKRLKELTSEKRVYDEAAQCLRAAKYGDMAILLRAFTDIALYEEALRQAKIPYYVVGGRGFFAKQEVIDLIHLLRVLQNSYDEQAFIGLLRSPFFCVQDMTLLALRKNQSSLWQGLLHFEELSDLPNEEKRVCEAAKALLVKLKNSRDFLPVPELLEQALAATHYREFLFSQFMGQQKAANVDKFCSLVATQAAKGACLSDFLLYIDDLLRQETQEAEAQIESESGNTVKLLTIHKSKGLEYPIVILPDLQRRFTNSASKLLFTADEQFAVAAKSSWGMNSLYLTLQEKISLQERWELKRLFYVAQTRAKDYFILSSVHDEKGIKDISEKNYSELNSWHQWLLKALNLAVISVDNKVISLADELLYLHFYEPEEMTIEAEAISILSDKTVDLAWVEQNLQLLHSDKAGIEPFFSATMLGQYQFCPRAYYYSYIAKIPDQREFLVSEAFNISLGGETAKLAVPAALLGSCVHKFIELYRQGPLAASLKNAVEFTAPEELYEALFEAALPLCEAYCKSSFARVDLAKTYHNEWHFTTALAGSPPYYFRGAIDRLVETETALEIVDFKTDACGDTRITPWNEHYQFQLQLYSWAAAKLRCKNVASASLYFLQTDTVVQVDPVSVNKFEEKLREDCTFLLRHREEAKYSCRQQNCPYCLHRYFCPSAE
ncbi:MAG: UvrD-helicase domain-containing protein [Sporomusaceae bacterium]|nr:UvrD-helicase domain-containing protein [Sporomusaceae bacterium]